MSGDGTPRQGGWLKNNILALVMVIGSILGTYFALQNDVSDLDTRVTVNEGDIEKNTKASFDVTVLQSKSILLEQHQVTISNNVKSVSKTVEGLNDRITQAEISNERTITVLEGVTNALAAQTAATTKLTEQVIRLEERSGN